jgi:hypothetical protein
MAEMVFKVLNLARIDWQGAQILENRGRSR